MKHIINKSYLLGLLLLGTFLTIGIIGITNGGDIIINQIITTKPTDILEHRGRFSLLNLGSGNNYSALKIDGNDSKLSVNSGLIVGSGVDAHGSLIVIGGGEGNRIISGNNGGIAGGKDNKILWGGENDVIGGGQGNKVVGDNAVVAGGSGNYASNNGVVIGGMNNSGSNGVILGGINNVTDGDYSLVMGSGAKGEEGSFSWNADAKEYTARIDAKSGVLIGTYTPMTWISLVVSGSVKLNNGSGTITGEIGFNEGKFKVYDGVALHTLGQKSISHNSESCKFGKFLLQNGDTATGYANFFTGGFCEGVTLTCSGGRMDPDYYPYCYVIYQ